jgi:hypothetical protein
MAVTSSVNKFNASIRQAQKADSASGKKISKAEVQKALTNLEADGKVSRTETKAAKDLLAKGSLTAGAATTLQAFVDRHDAPKGDKLNAGVASAILSKFNAANGRGKVEWHPSMPIGAQFFRQELMREKHPDGYAFTVLVPQGRVGGDKADPNKAKQYWIERSGGLAGLKSFAGPFDMPKAGRGGVLGRLDLGGGGAGSAGSNGRTVGGRGSVGGSGSGGGGRWSVGGGGSGGGGGGFGGGGSPS